MVINGHAVKVVAMGHKCCRLMVLLVVVLGVLPRVGVGGIPNGHAVKVVAVGNELCRTVSTAQQSTAWSAQVAR
jgi:hypothetical protein